MNKDIPKNLDEAIERLECNVSPLEQAKIAGGDIDATLAHHTFGRWLRNQWGLWAGSELRDWFFDKGIHHADDMSGIILESFQRKLRDEDIDLDGQIKEYELFWHDRGIIPRKEIEKIRQGEKEDNMGAGIDNSTINVGQESNDAHRGAFVEEVYQLQNYVDHLNDRIGDLKILLEPYSNNVGENRKDNKEEVVETEMDSALLALRNELEDLEYNINTAIDNFQG